MTNHKPSSLNGKLLLASLAFAGLAFTSAAKADTPVPVTITSGFNKDVVADGDSASSSTTAGIDGTASTATAFYDSTWASAVYPGNSTVAAGAFPAGTTVDGYSLAPAVGKNALVMGNQNATDFPPSTGTGSLSLSETGASTLYVLGTSGNGSSILDYTLTFAGGATQDGTLTFDDWGSGGNVITGLSRVNIAANTYDSDHPGIFGLYADPITVDPTDLTKALTSISFTYDSAATSAANPTQGGNGVASIFAVSEVGAVPEPSTWALMLGGMGVLILAVRRTRASFTR